MSNLDWTRPPPPKERAMKFDDEKVDLGHISLELDMAIYCGSRSRGVLCDPTISTILISALKGCFQMAVLQLVRFTAKEACGWKDYPCKTDLHEDGMPYSVECLIAQVREFGAQKYSRDNWKKGLGTKRCFVALRRHLKEYKECGPLDKESGLSHLGHALCCLEHMLYDRIHNPDMDDMPNPEKNE